VPGIEIDFSLTQVFCIIFHILFNHFRGLQDARVVFPNKKVIITWGF